MTHDELLYRMIWASERYHDTDGRAQYFDALRSVVELHKPTNGYDENICLACSPEMPVLYPCPTIKAIEMELQ